ncbi:MAG: branched-chain amino acid ABC transporter substrate-binding protein [bacterium]|nr:branched-chain amino acid ABC transporter substrate-binding protein [bacterium]
MPQIALLPTPQAEPIVEQMRDRLNTIPGVVAQRVTQPEDVLEADSLLIVLGADGVSGLLEDSVRVDSAETGLIRGDLLVLVVLVDGASIPPVTALPEGLRALAYTGRMPLNSDTLERDLGAIYGQVREVLDQVGAGGFNAQVAPAAVPPRPAPQRRGTPVNLLLIGFIFLGALLILVLGQFNQRNENDETALTAEVTAPANQRAASLADAAPGGVIQIGLAADFSDNAANGEAMLRGAELALQDRPTLTINNRTYTLDLLAQDAGCSAFDGLQAAETFTSDNTIAGVIGHQCSPSCSAAAPVYERASLTTISPACEDPALTNGQYSTFNRVAPSGTAAAGGAARYARETLNAERAAVVYDELLFGGELAGDFAAEFSAEGGTVAPFTGIVSSTADFAALADQIREADPQVLYVAGRPETAATLRAEFPDLPFLYGGGGPGRDDVTAFTDTAGENAEGVLVFAALPTDTEAIQRLTDRYASVYEGEPASPVFAYAYDATNVLLDAIESTGRVDPNGLLRLDRQFIINAVRGYRGEGVTGAIQCSESGDCGTVRVSVREIQNGAAVEIAVVEP